MNKFSFIFSIIILISAGCHRPEITTSIYSVPALDSEQKAEVLRKALANKLPTELEQVEIDVQSRTLTISFNERQCRKMNVEQVIAESGFAVNHRPAYDQKHKK